MFWKAIVEELLWFIKVSALIVKININSDYYYFVTVLFYFFTGINQCQGAVAERCKNLGC